MITEKQAADRAKGVGSSDAAAICEVCPWRTPWEVWAEKVGKSDGFAGNDATMLGSHLEAGLRKVAAEKLGMKVVAPKTTMIAGNKIMRANVDGMVDSFKRGQPIVEIKMTSMVECWGKDGTTEIPDYVLSQVTHQMICCDSFKAYVLALLTGFRNEIRLYEIDRDPDIAAYVEKSCVSFWNNHVVPNVAPPVTTVNQNMLDLMSRRERDAGASVAVPPEMITAFLNTKTAKKLAEDAHNTARFRLQNALGDAGLGESSAGSVKAVYVKVNQFDQKAAKAAHPEIEKKFRMTTGYTRLTVTPAKEAAS